MVTVYSLTLMNTNKTNLMKKETFCKKYGITEKQYTGEDKYTGYLYLNGLTSIPEGFNPTVGGYLELRGKLTYIGATVPEVETPNAFFWKNYALIDSMFCQVEGEQTRTIAGEAYTVYQCHKIANPENFVIVGKGNLYAHGTDFKSAFEDLQFKIQSEKFKNEPISEDSEINVVQYRAITGACNLGVKEFLDRHNIAYTTNEKGNVIENTPIKAKDLLVILKKSNAYGLDRFQKLLSL